jgi:GNAT superfamily N-acetyltransferase
MVAVGSIKWMAFDYGEVTLITVHPDLRRRGIARALWAVAEEVADTEGWHRPVHSTIRTTEGDAWARSMGAEKAIEIDEKFGSFADALPMSPLTLTKSEPLL